ncbi:hypothetical protein SHAb15599_00039 [Acinetobacter phage SH-Ab 15599]|nr:hypothetical protein SHAb15599_00039 [Acinetobacter phage SH-Ab 15599]
MSFYVYKLTVEDQELPFYIGKGQGNRAYYHFKNDCFNNDSNRHKVNTILKAKKEGKEILVEFVKHNLTEQEALQFEMELISRYGRRDIGTGCLTNMTNGGDGVSGLVHSEETRKKLSNISKQQFSSPEAREQLRLYSRKAQQIIWGRDRQKHVERVKKQAKENYENGNKENLLNGIKNWVETNPEQVLERNKKIKEAMSSDKNRQLVGERTKRLYNDPSYRAAVFPPFHRSPRYLKPSAPDLRERQMLCACLGLFYNFWVENGKRTFSFYENPNSVGFAFDNKILVQPIKQFQMGYNPWDCEEYVQWHTTQPVDQYWKELNITNKRVK